MKNAVYISLTVLALVGCGKVNQASKLDDTRNSRLAANGGSGSGVSRTLKQASQGIGDSIQDIYSKFDALTSQCDATSEAISDYNEKLMATETNLGTLQDYVDANLAFIQPFQATIDADNEVLSGLLGQIAEYNKAVLYLSSQTAYRDYVKAERKMLRGALNSSRKLVNQGIRGLRQAPYPSAKYEDFDLQVKANKQLVAMYEGQLGAVRDLVGSDLAAMKKAMIDARDLLTPKVAALQTEIGAYTKIIAPYKSANVSLLAQIAALPTIDGLKPYTLPPICQSVSK